ncbi:MAG TPA: M23 family metallopeptidase [Gemmatimonadota bacterium]|nr:M23 family metallopeptidase [Gemmatimonadota bacterium]
MRAPDPWRLAAGVGWGAALLALGLLLHPAAHRAWRQVRLMAADPPARLPVPVDGVRPPDLVDTWGAARSGGRRHEGIDIFAPRRTPVRSATEGIVTRRGGNPLGGRTVTVLGPGGWRHYYAHLEQYGGQGQGDWVEAGEVIGFVGTSGNAPDHAPHLHYAVFAAGEPVNPYPLLSGSGPQGPEDAPSGSGYPSRSEIHGRMTVAIRSRIRLRWSPA